MGRNRKIAGEKKGLRGKGGKGSQQGKVAKDLREEKGEDLRGGKGLRRERGERISTGRGILGRKRKLRVRKGLRGERGNGSQQGEVAKDLREEKAEDLRGGKSLGGKGGKGSRQAKGGKDLREEREKIWGQRP